MAPNIDQRGLTRPRDGNHDGVADYDIGAFEYASMPMPAGQVLALITSTPGLGHFTFQVAGPCFSGPGPEYVLVSQAAPGDIAPVYGRTPDGVWFQMFIKPGLLCWASGNLGTFDVNPFGLPAITPPPTATPIPTPIATATRTRFPTWTWFPSPTKPRPPIVCSDYKNKTDCVNHGCTWPLGAVPVCY